MSRQAKMFSHAAKQHVVGELDLGAKSPSIFWRSSDEASLAPDHVGIHGLPS